MKNKYIAKYIKTPLGEMMAIFTEKGLSVLEYTDKKTANKGISFLEKNIIFTETTRTQLLETELKEYFEGKRTQFTIPLDIIGTPFQKKIWALLQQIPYGKTISYKQQAFNYGDVKAIRAIGLANGRNKISIIIPCHRVIGSNGKLIGYAGGVWRKKMLLELEQNETDKQIKLF